MGADTVSLAEQLRLCLGLPTLATPREIRQCLRLLARTCRLRNVTLLLPRQRGLAAPFLLQSSTRTVLPDNDIQRHVRTSAHRHPRSDVDAAVAGCYIPFAPPQAGGLHVVPRKGSTDWMDVDWQGVAGLLATPALHAAQRYQAAERQGLEQLLARLKRNLARVASAEEVLQVAGRLALRGRGVVSVTVRLVQGGTLLLPPQRFERVRDRTLAALCADREPQLARSAAAGLSPRRRCLTVRQGRRHQVWLHALPVLCSGACLGTITLGVDPDAAPPRRLLGSFLGEVADELGGRLAHLASVAARRNMEGDLEGRVRELSTLFRISRALHGIPKINELMHFVLAAATSPQGGGFDRAMLFLVNEQTATLQGILGLTCESAQLTFPQPDSAQAWENVDLSYDTQRLQRQTPFCREVLRLRLGLAEATPVARAFTRRRIIFVPNPRRETPAGIAFAENLALGPYVCVPLLSGKRVHGVLVVDNCRSGEEIDAAQLGFLELFANLVGAALGNALLVKQLEHASQDLHETRDRLLHGERLALLGEMAASVAHELKTPLVSIGGYARRLIKIAPAGACAEYAGIVAREATRMEELLADILTFAKRQYLCYAPCRIAEMVDSVLQLEQLPLAQGRIVVRREFDPQLPVIQADEAKVRQVLLNLICNARQAMPQGGELEISAVPIRFHGIDGVEIAVSDSGPGIPAAVQPQLFTPFFSTKESGTGLGLAIAAQIVQQHQGEIEAVNRRRGASFLLRLPVNAPAEKLSVDKPGHFQ